MWYRLSIAASAMLVLGTVAATAAELPTYEVGGFPITPHQVATLGSAGVRERAPAAAPELAGMPASPLQVAVLARRAPNKKLADSDGRTTTGLARPSDAVTTEQAR